jgi:TRAP-type transport system periplasmic protein
LALPTAFTLIDLAVFGEIPLATLAASTEEFMLSCPQCQADYKRRNTIWLAGLGATHPKLLCAEPVTKLSDLKGLKIRTSGGLGRLAKAMGAVPVGMGSTAIYAGLLRGQLDCTIGTAGWLMSHRLMRTYTAQLAAVVHINGYAADAKRAKKESKKKNVLWVKPNQEFTDFMTNFRSGERAIAIKRAKKRGGKNPAKLVASHIANVAKWKERLEGKLCRGYLEGDLQQGRPRKDLIRRCLNHHTRRSFYRSPAMFERFSNRT